MPRRKPNSNPEKAILECTFRCGRTFETVSGLTRHQQSAHAQELQEFRLTLLEMERPSSVSDHPNLLESAQSILHQNRSNNSRYNVVLDPFGLEALPTSDHNLDSSDSDSDSSERAMEVTIEDVSAGIGKAAMFFSFWTSDITFILIRWYGCRCCRSPQPPHGGCSIQDTIRFWYCPDFAWSGAEEEFKFSCQWFTPGS